MLKDFLSCLSVFFSGKGKSMFSVQTRYSDLVALKRNEKDVVDTTESNRWGFCELAHQGLDLYSRALPHLAACFRESTSIGTYSWNTYYLNYFSFAAMYNSLLMGYYPQVGSMLRGILESFVRLRYFESINDEDAILAFYRDYPSFCRHHGVRRIFERAAGSWHDDYRFLCGFSHSGVSSITALMDVSTSRLPSVVVYNERSFAFLVDRFIPILHVHIKSIGHLGLTSAGFPVERSEFVRVLESLGRYSNDTELAARIEELAPGDLPHPEATDQD